MAEIYSERPIPKAAIAGAAAMMLLTIVGAATARWTGIGAFHAEAPAVAASVDLVFRDRADGGVDVIGPHGSTVLDPGTNGFVRGVLRGLARDRKLRGIGAEPPFRLAERADGRLVLEDPATGRALDLGAFGPTNADAFQRLLRPE